MEIKTRKAYTEFSEMENQIIKMIAEEMPNKEIAKNLNYSQRMIEYHISNIIQKLNVNTRVGIVSRAYKYKIIK
ncbi:MULTISPECIES: response regulator transcription factor [Bacillus cereus group]|uniref:response regulator transcription factor n=1 Tax=Bacillus cereus group TaxID=86661 RepID=UPI000BEE02E9|nr:LuxR C-terminal-related transcriptional regulator [Bacillus toyonensis]MED2709024.1 LuxR C-terminal-related transcriptional regulator [Bacillus toyonensis]MED2742343.1 LuxR C-terminal-related transcriptional regulator [Bacillus toyonensis]PDZ26800.1 helix-turn-helix transcriptional regulator [Bacillus toyonensis]PEB17039.1 helix-turn-helix transcriptional regulator [Bacillus toyonensis]PEK45364.1 helix-turn-helix transcriptional regulator [Bacillus toyonensis]